MRRKRECNFNVSTHPSLTEPDVNVYHTKCMYNCIAILYCDVHHSLGTSLWLGYLNFVAI